MRIIGSVSGGRSSLEMAALMQEHWAAHHHIVYVFANTGKENEETLKFVTRCDKEFSLNVVWVESVVHDGEFACTHKVVDFDSASRNGEPFEAVIEKYGIPNKNYLHCTRELKANPIASYAASLGWMDYITAIGIRADEPKRLKRRPGFIYPLAFDWPMRKDDVLRRWEERAFDLDLPEHRGNCDCCHKKSEQKLIRIAKETPQAFDWWGQMEEKHGLSGHNIDGTKRVFFRGRRSAKDILATAQLVSILPPLFESETGDGCSESCEAF